jgi:hypothetical protein
VVHRQQGLAIRKKLSYRLIMIHHYNLR